MFNVMFNILSEACGTEFCHCDELTILCLPISRAKISCRLPIVGPGGNSKWLYV